MSASASLGSMLAIRFVPMGELLKQLQRSIVPSERANLFLCLDEVQRRSNPYLFGTNRARHRILEGRGIESLLLVTKSFKLDGPMLETTVKLLATLCEEDAIAQHVLDIGGREQLENVCELHKEERGLQKKFTRLLFVLKRHAGYAAQQDARTIALLSQFCEHCMPLAKIQNFGSIADENRRTTSSTRSRQRSLTGPQSTILPVQEDGPGFGADKVKGDSGENAADPLEHCIAELIEHMKRYPTILEVQDPCLDGFISLGKGKKSPDILLKGKGLPLFVQMLRSFVKDATLVWKGCLAVIYMCKHDSLCSDLGRYGLVACLCELWRRHHKDLDLQQLLLWSFSEVSRLEANQVRCQREGVAALLRTVFEPPLGAPGLAVAEGGSKQSSTTAICIPLKLRRLYQAKALGQPYAATVQNQQAPTPDKKRRILDKPAFGRVGDNWGKGVTGLLS